MSTVFATLIADRTLEDVERAVCLSSLWQDVGGDTIWTGTQEELTEWKTALRGAYQASDLNRVESAVAYLAGVMVALPDELREYAQALGVTWDESYDVRYDPELLRLSTKTDWKLSDIPSTVDSKRYLSNVAALCDGLQSGTSELPATLDWLSFRGANAIETCLKRAWAAFSLQEDELTQRLTRTAEAWPRAGEIFTGEMIS